MVDFFFSPHLTAQERRLRAALQDGLAHSSRIKPYDPAPGEPVTLLLSTNAHMPIEGVAIYYTTNGTEPSGAMGTSADSTVVLAEPGETVHDTKLDMEMQQWRAVLPGQPDGTLVRYRADAWSLNDLAMHWYADSADPVSMSSPTGRLFAYNVDRWHTPGWFDDVLIYHVFVDRFNAASDEPAMRDPGTITGFFGGTLRGVLEKLDYIQALGANCVWLSPIFESPTHHGYNPSDYYNVAKRYGTNDTLRQFINEAHRRGMRVVLDFVANHTSDEHPLFLEARTNPDSAAAHWYAFGDWPPYGYRSYALVQNMPELVTEYPDVQRYLIDAALHWLGDFGADGLRLDYVPGPPHAFWTLFQREIKQRFPKALTLGEITPPLPEVANYAGRMDAFMDFPLARMMRRVFGLREATLTELLTYLDERRSQLPPGMGCATLLDNHDMHRFLWLADGNTAQLKLAAVCHMTLEGTPIVYYGTEVGLSQYSDAHKENANARAPMTWDERQNSTLLEHYRHLIALRHTYAALRHGARTRLPVEVVDASTEDDDQVGAYLRWLDNEYLVVVLNNEQSPIKVRISFGEQLALAGVKAGSSLHNLLAPSQEMIQVKDLLELELPVLGAAILGPT